MIISAEDAFEHYAKHGPESRIELVSNQLVLGGSLAGSFTMLGYVLAGWGAEAAVALATEDRWWQALRDAFGGPQDEHPSPEAWRAWAERFSYEAALPSAPSPSHGLLFSGARSDVRMAFFSCGAGTTLGRDFVMRLDDDGFTPDVMFLGDRSASRLYESHLDGPADIVIEACGPWNREYLTSIKRERYLAAGVREYWLIHPLERRVEFFRLQQGSYVRQAADADGSYWPEGIDPALRFHPAELWAEKAEWEKVVSVEERGAGGRRKAIDDEAWGSIAFAPRFELIPEPIGFKEYLAWAPEAKFEWWDERPQLGGRTGTRNMLGMLLMTFGQREAVRLAHPRQWVEALERRRAEIQLDRRRKAEWWEVAGTAARVLREDYGLEPMGVIGDLVRAEPLGYWSEILIVARGKVSDCYGGGLWQRLEEVGGMATISIVEAERALPWQREAITNEIVAI